MKRRKHDRLIERMMDGYWSYENAGRAVTDPERMAAVVNVITELLRSQPRCEDGFPLNSPGGFPPENSKGPDDAGALAWAADFLETRLKEDAET